jgi:hypothetical protein
MHCHAVIEVVPVFFAAIGGQIVIALPINLLQLILALFILYSVWIPGFHTRKPKKVVFLELELLLQCLLVQQLQLRHHLLFQSAKIEIKLLLHMQLS